MTQGDIERLRRILDARDALREAKKAKCTCSSFVLQYDGCLCERGKAILKAKRKLGESIDKAYIQGENRK